MMNKTAKLGVCRLFSGIFAILHFAACPANCSKDMQPRHPAGAFSSNGVRQQLIGRNISFKPPSRPQMNLTAPLHLVFLGDSTFRYEYLGLIYYLEKGRLYAPYTVKQGRLSCRDMTNSHTCSCPTSNTKRKNVKCDKHQIAFQTISPSFAGRELCDCYRGGGPSGKEHYLNRATENRCGPLPFSIPCPSCQPSTHSIKPSSSFLLIPHIAMWGSSMMGGGEEGRKGGGAKYGHGR